MQEEKLLKMLSELKEGKTKEEDVLNALKTLPFEDIGIAKLDHHRDIRSNAPEVVYAKSKTKNELVSISEAILKQGKNLLVTKLSKEKAAAILPLHEKAHYNERGEILKAELSPLEKKGLVAVVSAGTSDMPVVEEALVTLDILGNNTLKIVDAGVAGIHRLFAHIEEIRKANVVIVVAGMEGALASVVGGLVGVNVFAVPTSVGYGASFEGLAALLAMLNSCSPNISVMNIDNGFAAAYNASLINRKVKS